MAVRVVELNSEIGAGGNARSHKRGALFAVALTDALSGLLDRGRGGVEEREQALSEMGLSLLTEEVFCDERLESVEDSEEKTLDGLGNGHRTRIKTDETDQNGEKLEG